ncbi:MAG TPA: RND transporter, partial [Chitinophagaceae bacterium]|nr:RND transporter [Chitinophagaceae bacterium]
MKYLHNKWIARFLVRVETWVLHHRKSVIAITLLVLALSVAGMFRLKSVGYIVDDLPKSDLIYTDLQFFEKNFKGVMPLEILVDANKRNGIAGSRALQVFEKVDSLSDYIRQIPGMNRPLTIAEGLKFAKQGFFDNDSTQYSMPNAFDGAFLNDYLKPGKGDGQQNNFTRMLRSFMDSSRRYTRISVSMADVGTQRLPALLDSIDMRGKQLFDSSKYKVTLTGTSITFL